MTERITQKIYKNKFKKLIADTMTNAIGQKIKPSRIKLSCEDRDGEHCLVGRVGGYTFSMRFGHCAEDPADVNG